jgi:hypothetical protein
VGQIMKKEERKTHIKWDFFGLVAVAAPEMFSSLKTMVLQHWFFLRTRWGCVLVHNTARPPSCGTGQEQRRNGAQNTAGQLEVVCMLPLQRNTWKTSPVPVPQGCTPRKDITSATGQQAAMDGQAGM